MSNYLKRYECEKCREIFYFDIDSLPGGDEHCPYCEICSGKLIESRMTDRDE